MKKADFLWAAVLGAITALLIMPSTHVAFIAATKLHPYGMAFVKFTILATMGELLALRIVSGQWKKTTGMVWKAIVWGIIGIVIALMFEIFYSGVQSAIQKGLLIVGEGITGKLLTAVFISALLNLIFGPVLFAAHRIMDVYIEWRAQGQQPTFAGVVQQIDWAEFIGFVVAKTIPFFWIPAQTVTFLLPPEYRVIMAAYLSIALGAIMAYARTRTLPASTKAV